MKKVTLFLWYQTKTLHLYAPVLYLTFAIDLLLGMFVRLICVDDLCL